MTLQGNFEAIPFAIAAAVSVTLAVFAWQRRGLPMAPAFLTLMTGEAAWALFEALELVVVEMPVKKVLIALRIAGAVTTILGVLAFVLLYTGHGDWLAPRRFGVICAPAVFFVFVAWTNQWHHYYWVGHVRDRVGPFILARPIYAAGFWIHFAYCYVLVAVCAWLLAQAAVQSAGVYRAQAVIMLFAVLVPWIVNMIDMSQVFGYIHVDTAAMTFAVTGVAFLSGLFRFRLLDLSPIAWAVVVRGMNDPVVVIDHGGRVVDLNPSALRLVDRPLADVLGVETAQAFHHWPKLIAWLKQSRASDNEAAFEIDGPDPEKPCSFDARISRLGEDVRTAGWVLVLRDVSPQKRAALERDRMLREQAARAEAEATNIAKDRFLATLSHELRTPLTPVLATVTAMLGDADLPESLHSVLEMIRRNVVLEARLIDDLLDLSRIRTGPLIFERELTDAHHLVNQVIEICRADLANAGLRLAVDLTARRHHLDVDPIRFQQALWNLIKNAIKFTPTGGEISVRSLNRDRDEGTPNARDLVIEVVDSGIGIDPAVLPRIFDVMEQGGISTTRRFGGLGLGLTISRSILEQHGGRLSAHSPGPGQGATFTIEMPTTSAPAESSADLAPSPAPAPVEGPLERPLEILLVEDNQDTLNYLSRLLSLRGYRVHTAADLASAIQRAAEAEFDLVVSDIELPDGSGLELMWTLRATRNIPAIALSGFGSPADIEQSHSAGFAIHLTKPVDFRTLERAIGQLAATTRLASLTSG
jgi:signal transduction histidine kinase/ActR/RegA family two-component response regulator